MTTLIHRSPLGALDIPGVGVIEPDEPFDVPASLAEQLLEQSELYFEAGGSAPAKAKDKAASAVPAESPEANEPPTTTESNPESEAAE